MNQFVLPVRVYLEDTDAQGVVYNASYFRFLERARTEWLRAHGVDHNRIREQEGILLVLVGTALAFANAAALATCALAWGLLVWRLIDEEKLLARAFPDQWPAYVTRTWRLLPPIY